MPNITDAQLDADQALYQPSNGTEGEIFMERFCNRCHHESGDRECKLIALTMAFKTDDPEYPTEWCYDDDGNPTCTKFRLTGTQDSNDD